ncbi:solute carrier family 25 member 35-like isoform X2 [Agrilus planipennis]|uniref:Solute carrier family 25 member 35-like isoform X2 n=1 Tax=Agrilus planipennis TaxID=224129 RepID=A0A1W4XN85_AGRPL|nr:solute carrier family 25 member 35-like isoform X2 [Agrilus planipennis]
MVDVTDFIIGGLSAGCAGFFSNPLDVLKTRMQLQGELKARGLQKGVVAAVILHSIRNCIRLGLYQTALKKGILTDENGKTVFYKSFIISSVCGAAGAFVGSPLFLIKTQLQSQAVQQIAVGFQHNHRGAISALKTIYSQHGLRGLWRGANGTVIRAVAGSSAQLTSFLMAKDALRDVAYLKNRPYLISFIASFIGGVFQTVAVTPFDLISTRLYNQGIDAQGRGLLYSGVIDCCVKVWKTEGFFGFYKGVGANYMRLAPHSVLTLVFWDYFKELHNVYLSKREIVIRQKL